MRFFNNSADIPDELLIARDEGRVLFFCGAGVSMAHAGLPGFVRLTECVIQNLGISTADPVNKILQEVKEIERRTGVPGLISVDRIFSLLERGFPERDIEEAVAKALKPIDSVDLSAHKILLKLAKTPAGRVNLVTTNFDRLFELCSDSLKSIYPPHLPYSVREDKIDRIIHLHGCVNAEYTGAEGDGFILSSSEFGHAYLSDGWATKFFMERVSQYIVVFIGYAADDPPIQYLLEAINKKIESIEGIYSFQSGSEHDAEARWSHKGVTAIPYNGDNNHSILWKTLDAWADRAKSPDDWYESIITLAKKGPGELQPFQRGQVAHIVSTAAGVRKFSKDNNPPPAEWLCVFDNKQRYANPEYIGGLGKPRRFIDPFELYGLDSDIIPKQVDPDDYYNKREIPPETWDGLAANSRDRKNLRDDGYAAIKGPWAKNVPQLPSRLSEIGRWIAMVSDQPAALWWASKQLGLHWEIQRRIKSHLESPQVSNGKIIRQAWGYLFEIWGKNETDAVNDWFDLKALIIKDGWNRTIIRKIGKITTPYLKIGLNFLGRPISPKKGEIKEISDILPLDVEYPEFRSDIIIPDEWLATTVLELRHNLEHALKLENEIGGVGLITIGPIIPDDSLNGICHGRTKGLTANLISFSQLFECLIKLDIRAAKQEYESWPKNDDTIFSLLRIWASGKSELISAEFFGRIISDLNEEVFWRSCHQRDLLFVLAERWSELKKHYKKQIENRFKGKICENEEYTVRNVLNRLHWLASKGCELTFDLDKFTNRYKQLVPGWKPQYASKVIASLETQDGGRVQIKTDYTPLLNEPINNIINKAKELSGSTANLLVDKDPFLGLANEKPVLALSALHSAAKHNKFSERPWRIFLNAKARDNDKPKFSALIGERIARYPDNEVAVFIHPASEWIGRVSRKLSYGCPGAFDRIISKLIKVFNLQLNAFSSAVKRGNREPNWTSEAINSPVGKVVEALFEDSRIQSLKSNTGFPSYWLNYVQKLLSLEGDLRCYVMVILGHYLNWLYCIDPTWTENNILPILNRGVEADQNALWSGFLWRAEVPKPELYLQLKVHLLTLAKHYNLSRSRYCDILAGIIIAGWGICHEATGERLISNDELKDVLLNTDDNFRAHTLWQMEEWASAEEEAIAKKWSKLIPELLCNTWPRQKSVKTPRTTSRLFDLPFSDIENFPEISEIVLPLLSTINHEYLNFPNFRKTEETILKEYPKQTLALLYSVLPNKVLAWPHDIGDILDRIVEADESLRSDVRILKLKRKWDSR